ncbi:imidazolonepropionase [Parasphingorhabdus halotolerans]|uniref:Imidazolonepropionase n=1 Tax=Parasphingorhabdus halotolerans TaxID=2725558 RepID=A0A6H2DNG6_9SPHN|nr:imidazolonepropionase [Parasphingorhabdus halotolerans]QJB69930.1 imidazolonepropionase [Parasphingorhabdus halotolerans]
MWDRLWLNANLATMADAEGYGLIANGAIACKGGRIAWIGPQAALPDAPDSLAFDIVDAGGRLMTPGLIDCHTHLVFGGNRAGEFEMRLEGASYEEIARAGGGIISTVKATRQADEEVLYESASARLKNVQAEGVTTIEIKSGYGLDIASEVKMLRVAQSLERDNPVRVQKTFLGAHAVPPEYAGRADDYLDHVIDDMLPAIAAMGLIDAVDAFCENIAFSAVQLTRLFDAAHALGLPVKLHAEQLSDCGGSRMAASHGALSVDHLEYLDEADIPLLAKHGTVATLLPGAFYYLKETRLPPVAALRTAGVPMALATDCNPGSSPITSPLLILNMGCTLFGMTPAEALRGMTINAAKALGRQPDIGSLELGKAADLAIWNIDHPAELSYWIGANALHQSYFAGDPAFAA